MEEEYSLSLKSWGCCYVWTAELLLQQQQQQQQQQQHLHKHVLSVQKQRAEMFALIFEVFQPSINDDLFRCG